MDIIETQVDECTSYYMYTSSFIQIKILIRCKYECTLTQGDNDALIK